MLVKSKPNDLDAYDVIIVGSGPAGCSVAYALEGSGKRALIIETGGVAYDGERQEAFTDMHCLGHFGNRYWARHWVRSYGGTSAIWGGWCAPLEARDLETWPIEWAELADHYPTAAKLVDRENSILKARHSHFDGFDAKPISDVLDATHFGNKFERYRTQAGLVDVLLETTVSRLRPNSARSRVAEIELAFGTDRVVYTLRPEQSLVLAAGGIGNAQIMLTPFDETGVGVGNENDVVGRYLMEHPHFYDVARLVGDVSLLPPSPPSSFGDVVTALIPDDEVYARHGRHGVSIQLHEDQPNFEDPIERFLIKRHGAGSIVRSISLATEMLAEPSNRVTLQDGTDPAGLPLVKTNCIISSETFRHVLGTVNAFSENLIQSGAGRLRLDNEAFFRNVTGGGHIMGTTRMGTSVKTSVVDADCRVHNYQNLYVAGSSVFTTGGAANPTLTLVALANRLGQHLGGRNVF